MAYWNYRIVRHEDPGSPLGDIFAVHEAFYDDKHEGRPHSITANPCGIVSETVDGIKDVMDMMRQAFEKPVLDAKDFEGKTVEKKEDP